MRKRKEKKRGEKILPSFYNKREKPKAPGGKKKSGKVRFPLLRKRGEKGKTHFPAIGGGGGGGGKTKSPKKKKKDAPWISPRRYNEEKGEGGRQNLEISIEIGRVGSREKRRNQKSILGTTEVARKKKRGRKKEERRSFPLTVGKLLEGGKKRKRPAAPFSQKNQGKEEGGGRRLILRYCKKGGRVTKGGGKWRFCPSSKFCRGKRKKKRPAHISRRKKKEGKKTTGKKGERRVLVQNISRKREKKKKKKTNRGEKGEGETLARGEERKRDSSAPNHVEGEKGEERKNPNFFSREESKLWEGEAGALWTTSAPKLGGEGKKKKVLTLIKLAKKDEKIEEGNALANY